MNPVLASFATGALALAAFVLLNLVVLRLPGRLAPVPRQVALALLLHVLATLLAACLVPGVTYWHGAALYGLGFVSCLFGFSAVYKSVSLGLLSQLANRPDGRLPWRTLVEKYVRPSFTQRTALLVAMGLAQQERGRFRVTPRGRQFAARFLRVQRLFGIQGSGLYSSPIPRKYTSDVHLPAA